MNDILKSVRSQLDTECQKIVNNRLNTSKESLVYKEYKALKIYAFSGYRMNIFSNTVTEIAITLTNAISTITLVIIIIIIIIKIIMGVYKQPF